MSARCWTALVICALPVAAILAAAPTTAEPSADAPTCGFVLSTPQLSVLTGGAQAVTATLKPTACTGIARPNSTTVCLSTAGSNGYCATQPGWVVNQVAFPVAAPPSGLFTARARGCYNTPDQPLPVCTTVPDTSAAF